MEYIENKMKWKCCFIKTYRQAVVQIQGYVIILLFFHGIAIKFPPTLNGFLFFYNEVRINQNFD